MKYFMYLWCTLIIPLMTYSKINFPQKMIISSAVVNLRAKPENIFSNFKLPASAKTNPLQMTQLLFNEYVIAKRNFIDKQNQAWYLVEAVQQPNKNNNGTWTGLIGWVQGNQLHPVEKFEEHNLVVTSLFADIYNDKNKKIITISMGTQLTGKIDEENNRYEITMPDESCGWIHVSDVQPLTKHVDLALQDQRSNIINTAKQFLGNLYSWGGRTPQTDLWPISSVDCSGLINLVFTTNGLLIPRNSNSQYLQSSHILDGKDLETGDLIFFANSENMINHVLFYSGNGNVIESSLTAKKVREISFKKRIGYNHTKMRSGDLSGPIMTLDSPNPTFFKIYFGSFLSDKKIIKKLRNNILRHNY